MAPDPEDHIEEPDLDATAAYDFELPAEQIATHPASSRDASRLLEVDGPMRRHRPFGDIVERFGAGDCLVVNDVAVRPARVMAEKRSGGRVELLVLEGHGATLPARLRCFVKARRPVSVEEPLRLLGRQGEADSCVARLLDREADGAATVVFEGEGTVAELLLRCGRPPLPPYILKRRRAIGADAYDDADDARYQTVYAVDGEAVAAPTAGLHFTEALLSTLQQRGVRLARLRLDVGPGTFQPVRASRLQDHAMHGERYFVQAPLCEAIEATRAERGRVIAVGTTVVRALEDQFARHGEVRPGAWSTDIFLKPGHAFRAIDGMVTNFHLPSSTLLALVCAFGGYDAVMSAYREAVAAGYRFYSYGDAMLLWPAPGQRRTP